MTVPTQRCTICRSLLDEEDLFCSNCGTESPLCMPANSTANEQQASVMSFRCESCGASMSYDASAQTLRCPFCGSKQLASQKDARTLKPNAVVPFQIDRQQADAALRKFLATGFFRPGDAVQNSILRDVTQVYVPFWIFEATTSTYWTGDTSQTPAGARGNWFPRSGFHQGSYRDLFVVASSIITPSEAERIGPFDLKASVAPTKVDLLNVIVEEFRVPRKYARPLATSQIEEFEAEACQQYLSGQVRNVRVNVQISEMRSEPVLLPLWIMVYRYQDQPYRVLVNGQNAKVFGNAPFSYKKLGVVLLVIFAFIALFIVMIILAQMLNK